MATKENLIALVIGSAYFMQNLDATILTTALPQIAKSFDVDPVDLSIVITGYLVSFAVCIPVSGWLADRVGARSVFRFALVTFIASSVFCSLSADIVQLTIARITQGMSAAMLVPVGRMVLLRSVKRAEIVKATVFLTVPSQVGALVGPALGGLITTYASWHWIFFLNVPIGIVGFLFAARFIENYRDVDPRPFDWWGFVLTALPLAALVYAVELASQRNAGWKAAGLFIGGLAVGGFAVRHAIRSPHPLMDLSLLRLPTFAANVVAGSLYRIGWGGLPFLLPLLFQIVFGMDAFEAGLLLLASAVGSILSRLAGPFMMSRYGFRRLLIVNGLIGVITILGCGLLAPGTSPYPIVFFLFLGGLFQSLQVTALNAIAYTDVPESHLSSATALSNLAQQLSRAFGVALSALLLNLSLAWRGASDLSHGDFVLAFVGIAALTALSLPFFCTLAADAGAEVSRHQSAKKKDRD